MPSAVTISQEQLQISLGRLGAAMSDTPSLLAVLGGYMLGSVARTFRDQGSPAGSWPELASSTRKKKGYTAEHMLLVLSGRLRASINYRVQGNTVFIGSGLKYAAVHQLGSADRAGGSVGAQAKIPAREVTVDAHRSYRRGKFVKYGKDENGKRTRLQGPRPGVAFDVAAHSRHQNIPTRPYLVFRPEDEGNIGIALSAYMHRKAPGAFQ